MDADLLISRLGTQLGISDLIFSEDGTCSIQFDDDEICFEKNGRYLFVIANLGDSECADTIYGQMLEGNYLGRYSALGELGIDAENDWFTLTRVFEGDVSFTQFEKDVVLFIKVVRFWKQQLLKLEQE
ncbi:MAG: type III secretion system chaperone [Succinivibrio sp.]|nr:type III secretion system chaperone [Succinivibrio sp.]